ncbi:MAG TPA: SCO family protein [Candidatus Thalassarchaeaceae archaeon]|nr:SCO family protein [Candidatus Thalassarchaeaceae archaeon]|tara:strand:+ start:4519 stop:5181 length:663 start_codon:yes stop_codon:yes gene_type:complete
MALIMVLCLILPGCTGPLEKELDIFYGQDLPLDDPEYDLEDFSLMNFDGNMTNLSDFNGQVLIVSFVYSRCPDVCPIVSANLRWVAEQLPDDYGTNFSIIAITVDPWWDTSGVLAEYAMRQAIDWPHLTGDVETMQPIWESFHVGLQTYLNTSATEDNSTEDNQTTGRHHPDYLVDHSTATIIIDKSHQQRVRWNDMDWEPTLFLEDLQYLMDEEIMIVD